MFKKHLLPLLAIVFLCAASSSSDINIKITTVTNLQILYKTHEYTDFLYMPKWQFPRIFLERLPTDFAQMKEGDRNEMFIQIMTPLALKLQEENLQERDKLLTISKTFQQKQELNDKDTKTIENLALKYDIFTHLKGTRRLDSLINELILRVDAIPPSIIIAAAAIDSDWGTSRPAQLANNLYKTIEWDDTKGLPPKTKGKDKQNSKTYKNLYASIQDYALKINSGINYQLFRHVRAETRYREIPLLGRDIAYAMTLDSNLPNYAGLLDYTMTFYELGNFDTSTLKP